MDSWLNGAMVCCALSADRRARGVFCEAWAARRWVLVGGLSVGVGCWGSIALVRLVEEGDVGCVLVVWGRV